MNDGVKKWAVLIAAALSTFIVGFMSSAVNIALPSIGTELQMDAASLGLINTSYFLTVAMFLLPFGRLSDIHGRKKILICGVLIYTVSSTWLSFCNSSTALLILRCAQGSGSALIFATGIALVTSVFPAEERGKALGVMAGVGHVGSSLGPALAGLLTQQFGWRSIFMATVPLSLVALVLVLTKIKGEWITARGEEFDLKGSLIYCFALVGIIYGFSLVPAVPGIIITVVGILGLVAFVRWETKVAHPIINISLFTKNRVFAFSNLAQFILYGGTFAVAFLMSMYLQSVHGFSPQSTGLILIATPVVQSIFSPLAGRLSDRIEPRIIASIGIAVVAVGLLLCSFLGVETMLWYILGSLAVLGFGFALFVSPNNNAIMSSVDYKIYGVASAALATVRQFGLMFGMAVASFLFAIYVGGVDVITPEYYPLFLQGMKISFIIFAALCIGGIFASLARGTIHSEK